MIPRPRENSLLGFEAFKRDSSGMADAMTPPRLQLGKPEKVTNRSLAVEGN
jgi:hypothetical protein